MFRHKRNFSIKESPCKVSILLTPSKLQQNCTGTPLKRLRLSNAITTPSILQENSVNLLQNRTNAFDSLKKSISRRILDNASTSSTNGTSAPKAKAVDDIPTNIVTPPPTPIGKIESRIEALQNEGIDLDKEIQTLDSSIEEIMAIIESTREETIQLRSRRFRVNDSIEIAEMSQYAVRDLLNLIYHPGKERAEKAMNLFAEVSKNHQKKYNSISLGLIGLLESSRLAIENCMKDLQHEKELHERTLIAIEEQREETAQADKAQDSGKEITVVELNEDGNKEKQNVEQTCITITDDDVVVDVDVEEVALNDAEKSVAETTVSTTNTDPNRSEADACINDEDDDETDIEDEAGSFTPCQAQRPKSD